MVGGRRGGNERNLACPRFLSTVLWCPVALEDPEAPARVVRPPGPWRSSPILCPWPPGHPLSPRDPRE